MVRALILFSLAIFQSCATGISRVQLFDPLFPAADTSKANLPDADLSEVTFAPLSDDAPRLLLIKSRDARPDTSVVGAKKDTFGTELGKVALDEGLVLVDEIVQDVVRCFHEAGYLLLLPEGANLVEARRTSGHNAEVKLVVHNFWVEFMPGFWTVEAKSHVQIEVGVHALDGEELWYKAFRGDGEVSGGAVTRSMFEASINAAYAETIDGLRAALAEGIPVSAAGPGG